MVVTATEPDAECAGQTHQAVRAVLAELVGAVCPTAVQLEESFTKAQ